MPDPYQFPPGDQPADDPVRPGAGPDGGEEGTNEHGAQTVEVSTVAGGAQGGGYAQSAANAVPQEDPEIAKGDVEEPVATAYTPGTVHVGTTVTITGNNLHDVNAVTVGGVAATSVAATATSVSFVVGVGTTTGAKAVVLSTAAHGTINGPAITVS